MMTMRRIGSLRESSLLFLRSKADHPDQLGLKPRALMPLRRRNSTAPAAFRFF